jgi:competence protein ComEC
LARPVSRTAALCLVPGALLLGITAGRLGLILSPGTTGLIALSLAAVMALALSRTRLAVGGLCILALTAGLWCAGHWHADQTRLRSLIGHQITVTGTVADDPVVSPTRQVSYKLGNLRLSDGRTLPGAISVYQYPVQLQRGYQLQLTGKVRPGYGNAVVQLSYPGLTVLSRQQSWLEQTRQRFFAGVRTALPEPLASFGLGLLVGIRALIPKDMQAELTLVGLSHLVAVSGYNLTIIVAAVDRSLGRFGRGIALASSLWLIVGFLIVTGASASIVRASVVSVLSLLAAFYGRRFNPMVLILLTAAGTAAFNPGYLTDLGWLLSFLAFFGILVLAPAVEARLGNPKPTIVRLFIESTAAQITTFPLIMYFFGELSIVSPLTNLIILPMVPLAMATGFVAGLGGMLLPAFAGWLAWPALLLLGFMDKLIDGFAALPWAGTHEQFSLPAMLMAYAVIMLATAILHRRTRTSRAKQPPRRRLTEVAST